jgi:DNA helicase-2/ATP-dependent DNA helicase PcrA
VASARLYQRGVGMALKIIDEIQKQIQKGDNFLVNGGAGSGKTYSLMEVIDLIYSLNPLSTIACITFTNIAADEIKQRAKHKNLEVSTIHDFLWGSTTFFLSLDFGMYFRKISTTCFSVS